METKDWISVYAATLATILAAVKFYELYRDRLRIDVSYFFGKYDIIFIINGSKNSIVITNFKIFWGKDWMGEIQIVEEIDNVLDPESVRILALPAASTEMLEFRGEYRLPYLRPDNTDMYIAFTIAGRSRKITKRLTYNVPDF